MGANRIAIIGWGSLIWCPGALQIKSRWNDDGPELPLEFARISKDGRLTLVIHPVPPKGTEKCFRTFWAESSFSKVECAREDLKEREGALRVDVIHAVGPEKLVHHKPCSGVEETINKWLAGKPGIDAAVWTGLSSNWTKKRGCPFSPDDAMAYIRELETTKDRADASLSKLEEYFRNAPQGIDTDLRRKVFDWKQWKAANLPDILFEHRAGDTP